MSNLLANRLKQAGIITEEVAREGLEASEKDSLPFLKTLENLNFHNERALIEQISEHFKVATDEAVTRNVELGVAEKLPFEFSKRYFIVAYKEDNDNIYLAILDPFDRKILENARIQLRTNKKVVPVLVSFDDISDIMLMLEGSKVNDENSLSSDEDMDEDESLISQRVDSAPIVKLVESILVDAYRKGVSDIHIEPEEKATTVRFRVDGTLHVNRTIEKAKHGMVCSRIKIISGLDPSNKNIPQDGSFRFSTQYISIDLRVSVLPTSHGEKIVLRLLGADKNITYDLHSLGLRPYVLETLERAIRVPNGIILVTGPTGSGKTTTLYTILNKLATPETSLVTVEDPVERNIPGISQVQVNHKAGLGFAESLRSILRQDPDTIMVGEMRDQETAQIATRAAITGHLVLSTIHTNDAISTVSRLVDMGVEHYMISSSLKCVIAQRLVRKICPHCKIEHVNTPIEKDLIKVEDETSHVGEGCDHCNFSGYIGRTAVFEILEIDSQLERMISEKKSIEEMRKYISNKPNMRTMRDEVLELLRNGETTIQEAIKILYVNE